MKDFDYVLAKTAAEASAAAAKDDGTFKAGGTELLDRMKEGILAPRVVVNLLTAPALAEISIEGGVVRLGATATLAAIASHFDLRSVAPAVCEAALDAATPLVRNRGTLGGNLCQRPRCWYFRNETYDCLKKSGSECFGIEGENKYLAVFDNKICAAVHPSNLATILWALDAKIRTVLGAETSERGFDDFFVSPDVDVKREHALKQGELIESVSFDAAKARGAAYYEVNEKDSFDWALASCGARLSLDKEGKIAEARVVVSAVAPTPRRLPSAEEALVGNEPKESVLRAAADAAAVGATPLRDNAYKVSLLKVAVRRALDRAAKRARRDR
jgi:xanthine dehydrogenase YagS FAD-binding subunit